VDDEKTACNLPFTLEQQYVAQYSPWMWVSEVMSAEFAGNND